MTKIENNKKWIEDLIRRLNDPNNSTMEIKNLANFLNEMLKHVHSINKQLTGWKDRRQAFRNFYGDKLSHKDVKDLKITKLDSCSLFTYP